jgi:hypothetical protein
MRRQPGIDGESGAGAMRLARLKPSLTIRRAAYVGLFVAGLLVPKGLGMVPHAGWVLARRETERRAAPDMRHDVIVIETRSQLISTYVTFEVYIVDHGIAPRGIAPIFTASHAEMLKPIWQTSRLLEIDYRAACVTQFSSYWPHSPERRVIPVEIRLVPSSEGFSCLVEGHDLPRRRMPFTR